MNVGESSLLRPQSTVQEPVDPAARAHSGSVDGLELVQQGCQLRRPAVALSANVPPTAAVPSATVNTSEASASPPELTPGPMVAAAAAIISLWVGVSLLVPVAQARYFRRTMVPELQSHDMLAAFAVFLTASGAIGTWASGYVLVKQLRALPANSART